MLHLIRKTKMKLGILRGFCVSGDIALGGGVALELTHTCGWWEPVDNGTQLIKLIVNALMHKRKCIGAVRNGS